jgi:hypothetical protein
MQPTTPPRSASAVPVIRAARLEGLPNEFPALSWESFEDVKGIVALEGNAGKDGKALYDE